MGVKAGSNLRWFIALWPPPDWVEGLIRLQHRLRACPALAGARWTPGARLHLTLAFMGEGPVAWHGAAMTCLQQAAEETPPFSVTPGRLGAFPHGSRARVIWLGLDGEVSRLIAFANRVRERLGAAGFWYDSKPSRPHITLARLKPVRTGGPGRTAGRGGGAPGAPPWTPEELGTDDMTRFVRRPWPVTRAVLVQSRLGAGGPDYTQVGEARLGGVDNGDGQA